MKKNIGNKTGVGKPQKNKIKKSKASHSDYEGWNPAKNRCPLCGKKLYSFRGEPQQCNYCGVGFCLD